jgi:hypothetical protein
MSRATQINEKITLERIKKTLKDPITWQSLLTLIGAGSLITAAKIAKRPIILKEPVPIDTRRRLLQGITPRIGVASAAQRADWAKNKPSESELLRELTQRIQQELKDKGLLQ